MKIVCWFTGTDGTDYIGRDDSPMCWKFDIHGKYPNPDFPNNYIQYIKNMLNAGRPKYLMVPTHKMGYNLMKLLNEEGIDFDLVFPRTMLKKKYLAQLKNRNAPTSMIKQLDSNWGDHIIDCYSAISYQHCKTFHRLEDGQTLYDVLESSVTHVLA